MISPANETPSCSGYPGDGSKENPVELTCEKDLKHCHRRVKKNTSPYTRIKQEGTSSRPSVIQELKTLQHAVQTEQTEMPSIENTAGQSATETPECAICRTNLNDRIVENISTECLHTFHSPCLIQWAEQCLANRRAVKCPSCNQLQTDDGVSHIFSFKPPSHAENNNTGNNGSDFPEADPTEDSDSEQGSSSNTLTSILLGGALLAGGFILLKTLCQDSDSGSSGSTSRHTDTSRR